LRKGVVRRAAARDELPRDVDIAKWGFGSRELRFRSPQAERAGAIGRARWPLEPLPEAFDALAPYDNAPERQLERGMGEGGQQPRAPIVRVAGDIERHTVSTGHQITRRSTNAAAVNAATASAVAATIPAHMSGNRYCSPASMMRYPSPLFAAVHSATIAARTDAGAVILNAAQMNGSAAGIRSRR